MGERAVTRTEEQRMEFCRELTTNDSKKGRSKKRMERWKIEEKPKLRTEEIRKDDDGKSQICIVEDASRAHPVYIMNEQPAQSIPSDNYVEKSLIPTAYRYDRNFYCLAIDAMLNRIPLSQDLQIRVKCRPK